MITVQFTTSNSPGKYFINDSSLNAGDATHKRARIISSNGTVVFDSGNISPTINPIEIPTAGWPVDALLQIVAELSYPEPGGGGTTLGQVYLAPTVLNIKL